MMNNKNIYNFYTDKKSDNTITYEFKPELIICDNDSNPTIISSNNDSSYFLKKADDVISRLLERCHTKYWDLFYNTIMNEYIEEGYISSSQNLYEIIRAEVGDVTASLFINDLYIKNAQSNKVVKSLLYIMSELKPNQLNGIEVGITAFALSNKDYEIRDLALQCFEKWKDIKYLDLLKSLSMDVDYLDEYLQYIISKLEQKRER